MQRKSQDWKVVGIRLRLMTQLLKQADAELSLAHEAEFRSLLSEVSDISRSMLATFQTGNGSGYITPDTTAEPLTSSGQTLAENGADRGSFQPES